MPLAPGTRFGPYEIVAPIGAGGMGEVYRARDVRLQRDVAIKVLPESFAADPDRVLRFAREAQLLAALNHPGIAQIYGFEEPMLAMEFVDGPDLGARLERGAIPLDESLAIGRQIAEALEYAHERGIIHRDLKPANIKVMADGTVKVLDFGLAKAIETGASAAAGAGANSPALSPTFTSPAVTHMGVILGTAAYMAPEQAKGKPVDRRADIWALGVILFEMLSGRRIYEGETVTDTIAQVITQAPDWTLLPPGAPAAVRRIVRRCLEKDPRNRFQSAGDLRIEIDEYLAAPAGHAEASRPTATSSRSRIRQAAPWALAGALAMALLLAIWRPWQPASDTASLMRLDVRLGNGEQLIVDDDIDGALAVLSPDGETLVYAGTDGTVRRLYVRPLASLESKPLDGTEGAMSHFFSPDSQWIGFFAAGMLKKVALAGGAPVPLAPAPDARGGTWGRDGTIVFTPITEAGLMRVSAAGGTAAEVTKRTDKERSHRWPWFLPNGKTVLFVRQNHGSSYDEGEIEAVRLDTGERTVLVRGGTFPRYLLSGHLVYMRENALFGAAFDPSRLEVRGHPQPIGTGVLASGGVGSGGGDGAAQIAFSDTGTVAYIAGSAASAACRLGILDRNGRVLFVSPERGEFRDPRFSPNGARVALRIRHGRAEHVHVVDLASGAMTKVTFDGSLNGLPAWSPDGRYLAYYSDRGGSGVNIYMTRSDGGGETRELTSGPGFRLPTSFSPDGKLLAVMHQSSGLMDVDILSLADKQSKPFLATPAADIAPSFSPDGKWIVYQSDESGTMEVYVRPYPGPGGKWQISFGGGVAPVWTKGGRELVYLSGPVSTRFTAVDIAVVDDAIRPGKPQVLFEAPLMRPPSAAWYHVTADGSKFVILKAEDEARGSGYTHVTLVFNYFDEVRRLLSR